MDKKYKLTNNSITYFGRTLYQIQAIKTFDDVIKGYLGGYIEKEENLSHDDNAWVFGNARVYDDAQVFGNARVYDDAWVFGNARVFGSAKISFKGNYLVAGPFGKSGRMITIGDNTVNAGCFSGTFEEFKKAVVEKYGNDYGSYVQAIKIIEALKF